MYHALPIVPDLIIIDYHMPGKDGYETLRELKNSDGKTKIIIASGDSNVREQVLAAGAFAFHSKDDCFKKLLQTINKIESNIEKTNLME